MGRIPLKKSRVGLNKVQARSGVRALFLKAGLAVWNKSFVDRWYLLAYTLNEYA